MTNLHSVMPNAAEAKFLGYEPTWPNGMGEKSYISELGRGLGWHNYCASEKDARKFLDAWIREHHPKTYKNEIELWHAVSKPDKTICALARCHQQGFPLDARDLKLIENYISTWNVKQKRVKKVVASVTKMVTVQDRIQAQVRNILGELDACVDSAFQGQVPTTHSMLGTIASSGVTLKGPQITLVMEYLKGNLSEWQQAYNKEDEQLVEGYAYVGRRHFKKIIDEFKTLLTTLSHQQTNIRSQRVRKKKPVDKQKMANKLRFMQEFPELNIKSLAPVNIIGANIIWVYDTKKRRLGCYQAETKNSLYVKGTKIHGYKVTCEKILRKPEEQILEMMNLRKNQTANWFDGIRAQCKNLTGRTNNNLILLRID